MRLPFNIFLLFALASCAWADSPEIQFDRDIRPILADKCFFCHGPAKEHQEGDLRLDLETEARSVIKSGDPDASKLIARIISTDDDQMPPAEANKQLSVAEIELLKRWISEGAQWSQHWSFTAPKKRSTQTNRARDVIDEMIAAQIPTGKLSEEASREKLIRRVSFDLTGMPPSLTDVDRFLADDSPQAYEKLVDRLLASPHYGQRMGLAWLDAARYGDTSVYHADGPRDMWGWRDAVVDAYNQNMPFDVFSTSQLAGDLLPDATLRQKVLAGFNRNNGTTDEGGAFAEEYRVEYAVDRVKTTSTVWLGLTMECAQCHDHKYDPISQEEYYKFFAFFNVSSDGGMQTRKGNAAPTLSIPDPKNEALLPETESKLVSTTQRLKEIEDGCGPKLAEWITATTANPESFEKLPAGCILNLPFSEGSGKKLQSLHNTAGSGSTEKAPAPPAGNLKGKTQLWVDGRADSALKFDGSNWVDLGNIADFESTDSFSYGGWIKPQKNAGQGALLARMDDANKHRGFDLYAGHSSVAVHLINSWPENAIKVITKKKLTPDEWQHVFAVYDGSGKAAGIKIYVNGEAWEWTIEQDRLTDTIKTEKTLLVGSRHTGSRLKAIVDDVQIYNRRLEQAEVQRIAKSSPVSALLAIAESERTAAQHETIRRHYLITEDQQYSQYTQQQAKLQSKIVELKRPMTTVMVMGNQATLRKTFILNRGAYDSPTDKEVSPGTLAALPPMDSAGPNDRLGMAQWLFSPEHPLTSRVTVNRYWQLLFGHGLVGTPEDFGAQGEFPTHPDLLDWLAVDFREHAWDVKRMLKEIVLSKTYRQTSASSFEAYQSDPDNRLFARGPRFRLQGEFIRDTALSLSGLLNDEIGGAGVKPYQPAGLWAEVGLGGNPKFVQDHGNKLYRRSIYTYWKRSAPPPAMQIFDAPTREKCTIRRARTNTPLQALVTLNDTQFVEASRHLAERLMREGGDSLQSRIRFGFRLGTSRFPTDQEANVLTRIYNNAYKKYNGSPESAKTLLAVGESKRDESFPADQHAAWTIVSSAILNLDETLTRE